PCWRRSWWASPWPWCGGGRRAGRPSEPRVPGTRSGSGGQAELFRHRLQALDPEGEQLVDPQPDAGLAASDLVPVDAGGKGTLLQLPPAGGDLHVGRLLGPAPGAGDQVTGDGVGGDHRPRDEVGPVLTVA